MGIMPLTLNVGSIITTENTGDADATPSPTPAATATPTPSPTATPTAEPTATPTPTPTPTPSPTPEATATPTPSPSPTAVVTPSPSPSATPEATPSPTPEASPSASPDATPTAAPSVSPSAEPTPSPTPVPTPVTYKFESLEKATDIYENGNDGKLKADFVTNHGIADESTPEKIAYSNGWKDKKKEYYYDSKGKLIKGQANIGGVVYTFDNNGKRIDEGKIAKGIDVSKWQGNIDWKAVKASGVDYAIIRVGYRGYGSGALVEDPYFRQNIQGATAAGLKVGVYFFSQAVTTAEAVEEASMAIKAVKGYKLHYPIYFDTEAGRPIRIPEIEITSYGVDPEIPLDVPKLQRHIKMPTENVQLKQPFKVRATSLDANGHVNNEQYIQMALAYLPAGIRVTELRVQYLKQAVLGDLLEPKVCRNEDGYTVWLELTGRPCAVMQFIL
jgi:hypothetical protein